MTGEAMSVSAAVIQLTSRKGSYYDPDVVEAFVKVLKETTNDEDVVVVTPPEARKSWKTSKLMSKSDSADKAMACPILEISWMQMKPGMEVESVSFENKPYLKGCMLDQKIINNIVALRENTGKNPVIRVFMGKK